MVTSLSILFLAGVYDAVKMRNIKGDRAITIPEFSLKVKKHKYDLVIIQGITDAEYDEALAAINGVQDTDIIFYPMDDTTRGLADELSLDIYLNTSDLYNFIEKRYGVYVGYDIVKATTKASVDTSSGEFGTGSLDDPFSMSGDISDTLGPVEDSSKSTEQTQSSAKHNVVLSKSTNESVEQASGEDSKTNNGIDETNSPYTANNDINTNSIDESNTDSPKLSLIKNGSKQKLPSKVSKKSDSLDITDESDFDVLLAMSGLGGSNTSIKPTELNNQTPNTSQTSSATDEILAELHSKEREISQLSERLSKSKERVDYMTKLVSSIEGERDSLKKKLSTITQFSVDEQDVPYKEYLALVEKLNKALSANDTASKEIQLQLESKIQTLTNDRDSFKFSLDEVTLKLNQINDELVETKAQLAQYKDLYSQAVSNQDGANRDISALNEKIATQVSEISSLKQKLDIKTEQLESTEQRLRESNQSLDAINSDIVNLTSRLKSTESSKISEKELRIATEQVLLSLMNIADQYSYKVGQYDSEMTQLKSQIETLESTRDTLSQQVANLKSTLDKKDQELATKSTEIDTLTIAANSVEQRVAQAVSRYQLELDNLRAKLVDSENKLSITETQLISKRNELQRFMAMAGVDENGVSTLVSMNQSLKQSNETLRTQIGAMQSQVQSALKAASEAESKLQALDQENMQLRNSIQANSAAHGYVGNINSGLGGGSIADMMVPISYSGAGQIYTVLGTGGFGTTTTAVSLANQLSSRGRTVLLDFNIENPKIDSWFRINPLAPVHGYVQNDENATALNLFINRGVRFIIEYKDQVLKPTGRMGPVYFPGLYVPVDDIKLATADYSNLLTTLGQIFNYIVIDTPRLGTNKLTNKLIKNLCDVSTKHIVVCDNDRFNAKLTRKRLDENRILMAREFWLYNQCITTGLDQMVNKFRGNSPYDVIVFSHDLYGRRVDFSGAKDTKDRFSNALKSILS